MSLTMVKWKMRLIMADKKMSVKQVSEGTGKHPNTIGKWKNTDEMPLISGPELDELAQVLNCSVDDLLGKGEY